MNAWDGPVTVDTVGDHVEFSMVTGGCAAWSMLLTPGQVAALVEAVEALAPMKEYRRRRSLEAAREAASHAERGAA
jgi:hypothetical protein